MNHVLHADILKKGPVAWNHWRRQFPKVIPNLRKENLSGLDLRGAYLSGADLTEADLSEAVLIKADFNKAILIGAELRGAKLRRAKFNSAILRGASLSYANLYEADFRWSDLHKATFVKADLRKADFRNSNLIGVDLSEANLSGSDLSSISISNAMLARANLKGVNLNRSDLGGSNLMEANLKEADLNNANLDTAILFRASLRSASLFGANLNRAKLLHSDLSGANISGAVLSEADLAEADLFGADLRGAYLCRSIFSKANLNAVNLLEAVLETTLFSNRAQLNTLVYPLSSEQEKGAIYQDEEEFEKKFDKDSWKGREGDGVLLTFTRSIWRPVDLSFLFLGVELAVNRLQYLLTTDDDPATISTKLTTPCYHEVEQSVRVEIREGSVEVFLGFLTEASHAIQRLPLQSLAGILGLALCSFTIRKMIAETKKINAETKKTKTEAALISKKISLLQQRSDVPDGIKEAFYLVLKNRTDIQITREHIPLPEKVTDEEINIFGHTAVDPLLAYLVKEIREGHSITISRVKNGEATVVSPEE